MSVRDNLGGGISAKKLYDAFSYSGLFTADMTAEEMLSVLSQPSNFGNAKRTDVLSGVKFSSSVGINKTGSLDAATQAELYSALQYSGLVTSGMTTDQMLAKLSAEYPSSMVLYASKALHSGYEFDGSGSGGTQYGTLAHDSFALLRTGAQNTATSYARGFATPKIKVDRFKTIKFTVTYKTAMGGTSYWNKGTDYFMFGLASSTTANSMISGGGKTLTYTNPESQTLTDTVSVDVSSITGEYYVGAILKAKANGSDGDGIDGQMVITKIELLA